MIWWQAAAARREPVARAAVFQLAVGLLQLDNRAVHTRQPRRRPVLKGDRAGTKICAAPAG
jgi:hypothetical protein